MAYDVKFLKGTAAQYAAATKDNNAFYYISTTNDEGVISYDLYLGALKLSNASDLSSALARITTNEGDISTIKSQLETLTGGEDKDGSIAKMIKTAIDTLKTDYIGAIPEDATATTVTAYAKELADAKVASVGAADNSVSIAGTATAPTVGVKISKKAGNNLSLVEDEGIEGLYVNVPEETDYTVTVTKSAESVEGVAARYTIAQAASGLSAIIDIPKDLMVKTGKVETIEGVTYIVLVLNDEDETEIKVDASKLIEYVTAGDDTATIHVNVSDDHKVTANVIAGSITKTELHADVVTSLNKADSALQKADITTGTTNGTIKVDDTEVAVAGLDTAAYAKTTDFDAAGSASAAESNAKAYVDGALTWGEIK